MALTRTKYLTDAEMAIAKSPAPGRPCEIRDDEGSTWHGYESGDGKLIPVARVTLAQAVQDALTAQRTATDALATKRTQALNLVKTQVTRVKAIAAGSRTDADKWLLALSLLVLSED